MSIVRAPLGTKGTTAEAAIARLCLKGLPALELFERVAMPFRRAVPYSAGCWKPTDPRTLLFTGFGIEDTDDGELAAARWRFVDNELLAPDYAKFRDLLRRPTPVTTLHRETHGEPGRSSRYRQIHRSLGFDPARFRRVEEKGAVGGPIQPVQFPSGDGDDGEENRQSGHNTTHDTSLSHRSSTPGAGRERSRSLPGR